MMNDWREARLTSIERAVVSAFPCVKTKREDENGALTLMVYWRENGEGCFVGFTPDADPVKCDAVSDLVARIVQRLWECAPIVGRA